jgi:hypothetical protein
MQTENRHWKDKLAAVPRWAHGIETEPVKLACWFSDVYADWHPKKEGCIAVYCPTHCKADYLANNYLYPIVNAIKSEYSLAKLVIIRPKDLGNTRETKWAYLSNIDVGHTATAEDRAAVRELLASVGL